MCGCGLGWAGGETELVLVTHTVDGGAVMHPQLVCPKFCLSVCDPGGGPIANRLNSLDSVQLSVNLFLARGLSRGAEGISR